MDLKLKPISHAGIPEALEKIALYRYLNEPEEAESICRDILAIDADNQAAIRSLALTITDQFTGALSDRYAEAESLFNSLADPYEQLYYTGLLYERRAKAQLEARRIGDALKHAYHGELELQYEQGEQFVRVTWTR